MNNFLKHKTVRNAGWLIFGKVIQMVISLLVGLLTARYLGPSNYGLINYASAYAAFFLPLCTLGINSILVKELLDYPDEQGVILGSTLVLRMVSSLISIGLITLIALFFESNESYTILIVVICSLNLLFNIFEIFNYWFQSKLKSRVTAIVSLIAYSIVAVYKIILLITGKSVAWFAFTTSLDSMLVGILLLICYKKSEGQKLAFSFSVSKRLIARGVHFILPSMMVSIYAYADKIMLKQMLSESEVGYYSTAVSICGMWTFVLSAIIDSAYPPIMESYKSDLSLFEKKNRQLYAIVFYISITVSLLFFIFGDTVVWVLYGEDYMPAVAPLRMVTWYTAFSYLGVARNAWIVCNDKQKYLKYIYVVSALTNVCLNYIFIPKWGATGAAFASLVTQIMTTMIIPLLIKSIRRNSILIMEGICLRNIK